jgi:hypothetical protein
MAFAAASRSIGLTLTCSHATRSRPFPYYRLPSRRVGQTRAVIVVASSGGLIVVAVFLILIVAVAFGIFGRHGGEIEEHPLGGERGDGAPGAEGPGELSGQDADSSSAFDQHGTR